MAEGTTPTQEELDAQAKAESDRKAQEDADAKAKADADAKAKAEADGLPTDQEELRKLVLKERKDRQEANAEAAKFRGENKTLKETVDKAEREKLTKEEALAKDNEILSQKAETFRQRAFSNLVKAEAAHLGFVDPGDAVRFLDPKLIDEDDDSKITKALEQLSKDKPYLLKTEDSSKSKKGVPAGKGGNPGGGTDKAGDEDRKKELRSKLPILGQLERMRGN